MRGCAHDTKTVRTAKIVEAVFDFVNNEHWVTIEEIMDHFQLTYDTAHRILHVNMCFSKLSARWGVAS